MYVISLGGAGGPGGWKPVSGTVSTVGFSPYTPQKLAGIRIEPTRSEPYSQNAIPAATAAAAPPEEPPGVRVASHGLVVAPYRSLRVWAKSASMKATFVFPITMAPARLSRCTTVASWSATNSMNAGLPQVVCSPATLNASLIVIGTPCRGPVRSLRATASSAAAASANAASRRNSTIAFRVGFTASTRLSTNSVSSRELISRRRIIPAAAAAEPASCSTPAVMPRSRKPCWSDRSAASALRLAPDATARIYLGGGAGRARLGVPSRGETTPGSTSSTPSKKRAIRSGLRR